MRIRALCLATTLACLVTAATSTRADVIFDPVSVSTNMGTQGGNTTGNFALVNTINQSGLSASYISGVTDFTTYTATTTANSSAPTDIWFSNFIATGNVDFNLGGSYTIDQFALWNMGNIDSVKKFTLLASNDSTFATTTNLGSFTAGEGSSNNTLAQAAQDFSFAATTASYVRVKITSNYGFPFTGISEAAFGGVVPAAAVPEPASMVMLGLGIASVLGYRLRTRKVVKA
jgi:F5/8 type C domain/PEP-CTERM motif